MKAPKSNELTPLVDADILVYRLGFAAAQDEPIEHTLHTVKLYLHNITEPFRQSRAELYLTGKENFRNKVATIRPYKGNRADKPKPQYYELIREYLIGVHGAFVVDFQEADDALGIRQMELRGTSVIVSIDKDLDMIPGWHYRFTDQELYYVDKLSADRNFFKQVLTGDITDNIPGIMGMGPKTAEKILAQADDPHGWLDLVVEEYKKGYKDKWESALNEMMQLLWIRRKQEELCPWVAASSRASPSSNRKASKLPSPPTESLESVTQS